MNRTIILLVSVLMVSCSRSHSSPKGTQATHPEFTQETATATFAGGCFWCMQPPFEKIAGVKTVFAGYTGGTKPNPAYEEVSAGGTGHMESIQITYDPRQTSYLKLLDVFWKNIDPIDEGGQFVDRGNQYRAAIFFHTPEQRWCAEGSMASLRQSGPFKGKTIVTMILPASTFYKAEDYHQDYYKKNPEDYHRYRNGSGRDPFIAAAWKNSTWSADTININTFSLPDNSILKKMLTSAQYRITQEKGTEPPFHNAYWDNHLPGIYVDAVTGEPLFSSREKFDSGTGWPSFTLPLVAENVVETNHSAVEKGGSEVHSRIGKAHLGDLFNAGPPPTHLRYCIDSASLLFIAANDLETHGYGRFKAIFGK